MLHAIKCHPENFKTIDDMGFTVRKLDRPYKVGDDIVIQEWDPSTETYTGKEWKGTISVIVVDPKGMKKGYGVLGLTQI